jgi:hypothetical protein
MVNLDDGWISIIEELIAMELEMRSAPVDLSDRVLHRVRKALLVRVDSSLEERFAAMLEDVVARELERISDLELCAMAEDGDLDELDAGVIRELFEAELERNRGLLDIQDRDEKTRRIESGEKD